MKDDFSFGHAAAVVAAGAAFPESGAGAAPSSRGERGAGTSVRCSGAGGALTVQLISKAKPAKAQADRSSFAGAERVERAVLSN